jgi:hypothetical protein
MRHDVLEASFHHCHSGSPCAVFGSMRSRKKLRIAGNQA